LQSKIKPLQHELYQASSENTMNPNVIREQESTIENEMSKI